MVDFETLFSQEKKYGKNNFVEIAKKRSEGGIEFVSVAKGWFTPGNERRYKRAFSLPINKDVLDFIASVLVKLAEQAPSDKEIQAKIAAKKADFGEQNAEKKK